MRKSVTIDFIDNGKNFNPKKKNNNNNNNSRLHLNDEGSYKAK